MPTQRPTGTFISGKSSKQSVVLWSSASRMSRWVRCDICITGRLTPACRVRGRQQHWYVTKNPHRRAFNLLLPALEAFYLFFGRIVSVFMYLCRVFLSLFWLRMLKIVKMISVFMMSWFLFLSRAATNSLFSLLIRPSTVFSIIHQVV